MLCSLRVQFAASVLILSPVCVESPAEETLVHNVAEFDRTVRSTNPGDVIVLSDGAWQDSDLKLHARGLRESPIVLRAQTAGNVILTGTSRLRIGGEYIVIRNLLFRDTKAKDATISFRIDSKTPATHCRLEQCAVIGDEPDAERKWVSLYGSHNVIEKCRFEGKKSRGTLLVAWLDKGHEGHLIQGNFFGARQRLGKNGGETIRIGDSETSMLNGACTVSQNYFYRCDGEAEIVSNKSCQNTYSSNVFVGCSGALTLRHGNHCLVENNVFLGDDRPGTGGVRIIGEHHTVRKNWFVKLTGDDTRAAVSLMNGVTNSAANEYVQVKEAVIEGNSFIDCTETFVVGNFDGDQKNQTLPPTHCTIVDNRAVSRKPIFSVVTKPVELKCSGNTYAAEKLGLTNSVGWNEVSRDALKLDGSAITYGSTSKTLDKMLQSTGPQWLMPGEESLPSQH